MTHFGIICPAMAGHLNPMTTLGYELQRRGHRVTVLGIEDARSKVVAAGLEFKAIDQSDFSPGATKDLFTQLGKLSGSKALEFTINAIANTAKMFLRDAPEAARSIGIEALLVDQAAPEGGSVAEHLGIPFVSICNALMLNREINVPPFSTLWNYDPTPAGLERNRLGYEKVNSFGKYLRKITNDYRQQWNLPTYDHPNKFYSHLAQIAQQPNALEFPRKELPGCFHFIGSCTNKSSRESVSFLLSIVKLQDFEYLEGDHIYFLSLS